MALVEGGVHLEPVPAGDKGLNDAALLRSPSSSCCFFASAWRWLHVNFPEDTGGGVDLAVADCCAIRSNGLTSFFGAGRLTGV